MSGNPTDSAIPYSSSSVTNAMGGTEGFTRALPSRPRIRVERTCFDVITRRGGISRTAYHEASQFRCNVRPWLRKIDGAHAYRIAVDVDGEIHWLAHRWVDQHPLGKCAIGIAMAPRGKIGVQLIKMCADDFFCCVFATGDQGLVVIFGFDDDRPLWASESDVCHHFREVGKVGGRPLSWPAQHSGPCRAEFRGVTVAIPPCGQKFLKTRAICASSRRGSENRISPALSPGSRNWTIREQTSSIKPYPELWRLS